MKVAYTMAANRGGTDLLLAEFAQSLIEDGLRVCGVAQINTERASDHPCDMDVKILPQGPVIRISQNLGAHAKGCRLDPEALEMAVVDVTAALRAGADVLILNKFGKHEADGRGFRDVIAEALEMGVPVVTGLNTINQAAFEDFSGGLAREVLPDLAALRAWISGSDDPTSRAA